MFNGGILGKLNSPVASGAKSGVWSIRELYLGEQSSNWRQFPSSGLQLLLDAGNPASYSGSGTTWTNLMGTGNFTINQSAYNSSGVKFMDFNGSFGCAKKIDSDFTALGTDNVTFVTWTRITQSTSNWRTLLRGLSSGGDHQVIIQSGAYTIGMYDNVNASAFNSSGFNQNSIPGWNTGQWNMLVWRWRGGSSPYYNFSYNDSPNIIRGSNTSSNARFKNGICSIGAYNEALQSNPSTASQYWGDIAACYGYNRYLTDQEILDIFSATRARYGM